MAKGLLVVSTIASAGAVSCTGSGDPVITQDVCYAGSAGALGLKENVKVRIHSFVAGTVGLDITGDGITGFQCLSKTGKKSGQDVTVDFGNDGCLPSGIVVSSVKYCSDDDSISVTVKDTAVPLPISAKLTKASCSATLPSMFDDFKADYGKVYNGKEDLARERVFNSNIELIKASNRVNTEFTLGVNQFADLTKEEFAAQYLQRKPKTAAAVPVLGVHKWDGSQLDTAVDWSTKGAVTQVKDQGQCGGCWAFAATAGLEGANFVSTGKLTSLAEQQFLDCDKTDQGCGGGLEYDGWDFFKSSNLPICTEASYPYRGKNGVCTQSSCSPGIPAGAISGVTHVGTSANDLMSAVTQQPISIGIQADQGAFQLYNGGILTGKCGRTLDHSVLLVGYEQGSYWKVKNSWGASWGENGYIRMTQTGDECGVYDDASYPSVAAAETMV